MWGTEILVAMLGTEVLVCNVQNKTDRIGEREGSKELNFEYDDRRNSKMIPTKSKPNTHEHHPWLYITEIAEP